jgi:glycosyltransferase involved in cell wall biosynthesis
MRVHVVFDHFIPLAEKYSSKNDVGRQRLAILQLFDIAMCWLPERVLTDTAVHASHLAKLSRRPRACFLPVLPLPFASDPNDVHDDAPDDEETFRVLWVGGNTPFQGLPVVLESVQEVAAMRPIQRVEFLIVSPHAPMLQEVGDRVAIKWLGRRTAAQVAELNSQATVVLGVFGSDLKAERVIPYKVLDGLASGRPVVTRRSPAMSEHFQDGTHYVGCRANDPKDLAKSLLAALSDSGRRKTIGRAGRARWARVGSAARCGALITEALSFGAPPMPRRRPFSSEE